MHVDACVHMLALACEAGILSVNNTSLMLGMNSF